MKYWKIEFDRVILLVLTHTEDCCCSDSFNDICFPTRKKKIGLHQVQFSVSCSVWLCLCHRSDCGKTDVLCTFCCHMHAMCYTAAHHLFFKWKCNRNVFQRKKGEKRRMKEKWPREKYLGNGRGGSASAAVGSPNTAVLLTWTGILFAQKN